MLQSQTATIRVSDLTAAVTVVWIGDEWDGSTSAVDGPAHIRRGLDRRVRNRHNRSHAEPDAERRGERDPGRRRDSDADADPRSDADRRATLRVRRDDDQRAGRRDNHSGELRPGRWP